MSKRFAMLSVVVAGLAVSAAAGQSVRAQAEPLPFAVGDTVTLRYTGPQGEWAVECAVKEFRGVYVRCETPEPIGRSTFGVRRVESWRSLKFVVEIQKAAK